MQLSKSSMNMARLTNEVLLVFHRNRKRTNPTRLLQNRTCEIRHFHAPRLCDLKSLDINLGRNKIHLFCQRSLVARAEHNVECFGKCYMPLPIVRIEFSNIRLCVIPTANSRRSGSYFFCLRLPFSSDNVYNSAQAKH